MNALPPLSSKLVSARKRKMAEERIRKKTGNKRKDGPTSKDSGAEIRKERE